jgi:hypothetical protein
MFFSLGNVAAPFTRSVASMRSLPIHVPSIAATVVAMLFFLSGCGPKEDLNKAKSSVETALNHWKSGEPADKLASQGIEMFDEDWKAGAKLLDYSIKNSASMPQQGPRVVVTLNLQRRNGKKADTEVAYEVLMKDKIKIGRDAFHVPSK